MSCRLMKFCPATGEERPYPSHAKQWREYHGQTAWLINPYTGDRRKAEDVGLDPFGQLIDSQPLRAASGQGLPDSSTVAVSREALEALRLLVDEIDGLIDESGGVFGLHMNGDPSPWGEILPGGRFERLCSLEAARSLLDEP